MGIALDKGLTAEVKNECLGVSSDMHEPLISAKHLLHCSEMDVISSAVGLNYTLPAPSQS